MVINILKTEIINLGVGQTPATVNVSATSTEIVAANNNRSCVFLTNIGKDDVWMALDTAALLDKGILLGKNGGSLLLDLGALTVGAINGIAASGKTSDVTFLEMNR